MTIDRILVAVDGSTNGHDALVWVAGLSRQVGADVIAVHAVGLLDRLGGDRPTPALPNRSEIAQRFTREWCAPLDAAGISSRRVLRDGPATTVILTVAEEEDVDLIVVGCRGHSSVPARLLGSTSSRVTQESTRPVTVIPSTS